MRLSPQLQQNRGGNQLPSSGGRGQAPNAPGSKLSGTAFTENELEIDIPKKKFTGRCRLYIGNLPLDLQENELKEYTEGGETRVQLTLSFRLFTPHGDISECYISGKGFAFLRLVRV
jgi:proline- and glutamine-rich splicing factor